MPCGSAVAPSPRADAHRFRFRGSISTYSRKGVRRLRQQNRGCCYVVVAAVQGWRGMEQAAAALEAGAAGEFASAAALAFEEEPTPRGGARHAAQVAACVREHRRRARRMSAGRARVSASL